MKNEKWPIIQCVMAKQESMKMCANENDGSNVWQWHINGNNENNNESIINISVKKEKR